jgi:choline dehydrogenase-like flavoprotein
MPDNNQYDAIVIGSGISGGWAAKELCEKGLKTIMLERGMNIEHVKDYKEANKEAWDYPHRGGKTQQMLKDYPKLQRDYPLNERNLDWWASDKDSPYTEVKRFDWFRGYHVGGRSLLWGRQSYRWSDMYFEENAKQGIAVDWPVRYKEIEPWYTYVEKIAGVSGSMEQLQELPDSHFLPAMEMNCVEKDLSAKMKSLYNGNRKIIIGRTAHATTVMDGRKCEYRNKCWYGCPFGGYFSTQSVTLPAAMKTGNLTLRPWSIVTKILYDKDKKRATGVEILDAETNKTYQYFSKIVFLNASSLNSAWVLMNSATDVWPDGLGSSSGELGHNVMDHHLNVSANGLIEGYDDKYFFGRRANGIYIPRYRNFFGDKRDYLRGFGYQGGAGRGRAGENDIAEYSIGAEFKDALTEPGAWHFNLGGFGETLPYHENKVTLDKNTKDKWGLNVLSFDCELKENELKMRKDMLEDAKEMLTALGAKNIQGGDRNPYLGRGIHEMGTARMGHDQKTSVLNKWNQVWDAPNVFVTDGAFMVSSACQNPSLTYMAFTARAADHAVEELKKRNL